MAKIQILFTDCKDFIREYKIQSIKAIRQASSDHLGFVVGLREAKDVVDDLINGWTHTLLIDAVDFPKVYSFVAALRQYGFDIAGYEDEPATDPFTTIVVDAVKEGNYAYAVALLQAKIKFGGAHGA